MVFSYRLTVTQAVFIREKTASVLQDCAGRVFRIQVIETGSNPMPKRFRGPAKRY
jgi:hypothetical protein